MQTKYKRMKQSDKSFVLVVLTIVTVLAGCGSTHNKKNDGSRENSLPKIRSFKIETNFNITEDGKGVHHLTYDSLGRLVNYVMSKSEEKYAYADNGMCSVVSVCRSDSSVMGTSEIRFNDKWMPLEENFVLINSPIIVGEARGTISYRYDEKGRILSQDCETRSPADGIIFKSSFKYDASTGLLSEVKLRQKFPGWKEASNQVFGFEYSDRDNPLAFYPEYMMWFVFNGTLGTTPQSGYGRDKLLDKIWILSSEGKKTAVLIFTYDFSSEDKLTGIYISYHEVDPNGDLLPELRYFKITEISAM